MTDDERGDEELRHQINEVFFGTRADDPGFEVVWEACLEAHNNAVRLLKELVSKTITHYDKLPNAAGDPHEIMGLLPAAQFLMAINGHSASMLDGICAALVQDTEGDNETGSAQTPDPREIGKAIQQTIQNIRKAANEEMLGAINMPGEGDE